MTDGSMRPFLEAVSRLDWLVRFGPAPISDIREIVIEDRGGGVSVLKAYAPDRQRFAGAEFSHAEIVAFDRKQFADMATWLLGNCWTKGSA